MDGTLQLSYTAGKLLCPKQSFLLDDLPKEASEPPQRSASTNTNTLEQQQQPVTNRVARKPGRATGSPSAAEADGGRRAGSGSGEFGRSTTADGRAVAGGGGSEGGFGGLIYMLRSLGSPMQVKSQAVQFCCKFYQESSSSAAKVVVRKYRTKSFLNSLCSNLARLTRCDAGILHAACTHSARLRVFNDRYLFFTRVRRGLDYPTNLQQIFR